MYILWVSIYCGLQVYIVGIYCGCILPICCSCIYCGCVYIVGDSHPQYIRTAPAIHCPYVYVVGIYCGWFEFYRWLTLPDSYLFRFLSPFSWITRCPPFCRLCTPYKLESVDYLCNLLTCGLIEHAYSRPDNLSRTLKALEIVPFSFAFCLSLIDSSSCQCCKFRCVIVQVLRQ